MAMKIFITRDAGYISSHTLLRLLAADHALCVLDNWPSWSPVQLSRVR
jgi:UDP-glucose 4-epimerase